MRWMRFDAGVGSALLAGILFGASTPLAKRLIQDLDPWMLAGLLYLGSGLGLGAYRALRHAMRDGRATEASLRGADRWWLAAAILAGGIVAPVLMMYGLRRTAGSTA
jgi:drug/metabolite transporter (DMT)-like permease